MIFITILAIEDQASFKHTENQKCVTQEQKIAVSNKTEHNCLIDDTATSMDVVLSFFKLSK